MPKRKKTFPCGHKGYGKVCHRCQQTEAAKNNGSADSYTKRRQKEDWEASFEKDPIDLRPLPRHVVKKARSILKALDKQKDYRQFGGKRLRHNRTIISIPITRNYRMICRDDGNFVIPQEVLSHEDYNVRKPGG
ncbi:hypothetical protein [Geitlerinema sp. PCC 9228]|jgi:hypothetical protein|uniref:DUF7682 family zinc-binding protein n=1 Tax=Geitlerinema sp. PCC 9228 TaxID=111611 RepID=UPI0008F9B57C|nr:hypothetical protein [Geitlerinema sp. PCC 9228]